MKQRSRSTRFFQRNFRRGIALCVLLPIVGLTLAGPSGLLAWGKNRQLLEQRKAELATLTQERDDMRNRVDLLNPQGADPDLAGELVRSKLNVAHPDEMVMLLR